MCTNKSVKLCTTSRSHVREKLLALSYLKKIKTYIYNIILKYHTLLHYFVISQTTVCRQRISRYTLRSCELAVFLLDHR